MTDLRKALGQVFFIGFAGLEVPASIEQFMLKNAIGGVTLFANNYDSPAQLAELVNHLQEIGLKATGQPLIIAVDHEGGKVQRFREGFTRFPEARVIGDANSPKLAFECAEIIARELRAVGVNMNFAPVADINTNPKNPVIGRRAFGETEEMVSKMVSAYVRGFLTGGVQPVVKHFPGHGDTSLDSHFHLPKVSTPLATINERESRPFIKAFKSKCQFLMSSHVIVEAIDPKLPATLSTKVLKDYLRDELRYKGFIFSDDMEMKALADNFGNVDAAFMALSAGIDILLYHTEEFQTPVFDPLLARVTADKAVATHVTDAAMRLKEFKSANLGSYKKVDVLELSKVFGSAEHLAFAEKLSQLRPPKA